jgi:fructose-bisphosphate aldolase class II
MLVDMADMLRHAQSHGYAVGAFDLVSLDLLQAILAGAEHQCAPVILSLAESHYSYTAYRYKLRFDNVD